MRALLFDYSVYQGRLTLEGKDTLGCHRFVDLPIHRLNGKQPILGRLDQLTDHEIECFVRHLSTPQNFFSPSKENVFRFPRPHRNM
jgi:hypothetical protein